MDDDLGLELDFDRNSSPPFRGRGRGRAHGFSGFKTRTPRGGGFRGSGGRGGESRRRGRGEGMRRGRGGERRGRGEFRSNYDYEPPHGGYKDREYESSREYAEFRSPPSYNSYAENGYSSRDRRGSGRGPSRGGFPGSSPRRGSMDHYSERSSYGGSFSASKGPRDYPDYPREGGGGGGSYEDSYTYGREKYRDERYQARDYKYRGSPNFRDDFRRGSPPRRMMSPPRRRMSPPPRRMSPPPRFRSRSPIMMRSRSPMGRGDRFRGSSRGGRRRPWTPPPPQRRERSRSPRYADRSFDGPPSRKEFHDRDRFMGRGGGGRGFRPREYPPSKPGFRPKGPPYSGERY